MSKYSHLVLAMESEGAISAGADTDEVAAAETATEVEQNVSETNEMANNVAEVDTGIGNAADASEGLAEVSDAVEAKVESGDGMTESEAEFAEMAVEAYCKMVGISARKARIFPSMESFGGRGSRLRASKLALEGIGDTLKRIWEAIKAGIARAIEMIKSFFNGFIKSRDSVEKHLNNLEQRLNDLPSNAKNDKDSFSTGAASFTIGGKAEVANITTILTSSASLLKQVPSMVGLTANLVSTGYELTKNQSVSDGDWGSKIGAEIGKMAEAFRSGASSDAKYVKRDDKDDKDTEVWEGQRLTRNRRTVIAFSKPVAANTSGGSGKVARVKLTIEDAQESGSSKDMASSIPAPKSISEMDKILTAARDVLKQLKQTDVVFKDNMKQLEEMKRHADSMMSLGGSVKAAGTTDSSEKNDIETKARKQSSLVTDTTKMMIGYSSSIPNVVFDAVKSAADYIAAGIANMKVEKK